MEQWDWGLDYYPWTCTYHENEFDIIEEDIEEAIENIEDEDNWEINEPWQEPNNVADDDVEFF